MSEITYRVIRSDRRTLAIQILPDETVVVRSPYRIPEDRIRAFVESKADWIRKHRKTDPQPRKKLSPEELHQLAAQAKILLKQRLDYYAPIVGVSYGRVTIRHQRTRWGSCSAKGNLNFNCLLALTPLKVLDYVVVHELCHLRELNHSSRFWAAVERVLPDYKASRKWLKEHGAGLTGRLP